MRYIEDGRFRVHYSGDSGVIAERLMETTKRSYPILKDVFRADRDLGLEIYWADNADWSDIPSCRHKGNYGMPHMAKGDDYTRINECTSKYPRSPLYISGSQTSARCRIIYTTG